jgi:microcompartment protein CcmL/EutN
MPPEALALVEFHSIAAGTRAVDALVKRAAVRLERVGTLQPGKLAVMFSGDVASVQEAYGEAIRVAGRAVQDKVMLPHVAESVYRAALGKVGEWAGDTLGIIETSSMAATIEASDAAVKGANVRIVRIRLGDGLGGKGLVHLVGAQHDVEAAIGIGVGRVALAGRQVESSVTPRVHGELVAELGKSTRFWQAGGDEGC